MKKIVFTLILFFVPALAQPGAAPLDERIEALEKRQSEIYHTLAEKKAAGLQMITERISFSGLLEVEASFENLDIKNAGSDASSDLALATAQIGFGATVTDNISGDILFLYEEEDDAEIEVDEAAINFEFGPWFGRVGRQYVPFGAFYSHCVSDPLTLALGETRETAALAGYRNKIYSLSAFVFNGDVENVDASEDHIRDWGLSLTVTPMEEVEFGASYLSDLADTDAELVDEYQDRVAGWSAYAVWKFVDDLYLSGEVLGSMESFDQADLDADSDGRGDKPLAWNVELGWHATENVEFAARVEGSDEFADQPELQYGLCAAWGPWEKVTLALEYLHGEFDEDFSVNQVDSRDLVTAQLALEF